MLILGAATVIMLCGFAAFAIDLGYISLTQAQLQNACDAGALAAVLELKTGNSADRAALRAAALDMAKQTARMNFAAGRPVELRDQDVTFGNRSYNPGTGAFDSDFNPASTAALNAVRVECTYNEAAGDRKELDLYFARLLNIPTAIVAGASSAFMSPRDLVFAIDISNSMNDDSNRNLTQRATLLRGWFPTLASVTNAQMDSSDSSGAHTADHRVRFRPYQPYTDSGNATTTTLPIFFMPATNIPSGAIVRSGTSSPYRIQFNIANHGLITDDVVIIVNTDTSTSPDVPNSVGTFRVEVLDANSFQIKDSSGNFITTTSTTPAYNAYPQLTWTVPGVFRSPTDRVRVRLVDPGNTAYASAGLGLGSDSLLRFSGVGGVSSINGTNRLITRVGGPLHSQVRYDLNALTFSGAHTGGGTVRVPNYRNEASNTERTILLRQYWLMCLDSNGTYPNTGDPGNPNTTGGHKAFRSVEAAEELAANEFPSGATDPTYTTTTVGYYTAYDSLGADPMAVGTGGRAYSYPNGHPWLHWKWRAFINACFGRGYGSDLNVTTHIYQNGGGQLYQNREDGGYINWERYVRFALDNGYVPAMRGQQVWGRDVDMNGQLDVAQNGNAPPPNTMIPLPVRAAENYADYPYYAGFYSKPTYLKDYSSAAINFTEGSAMAGLHPLNVPDLPFSFVRQATLNGVNAMISDENTGNAAFDQVAMVTFGTRAYTEADLTNDVQQALVFTNNRLAVTGSNLGITPKANGNTNIGGALRMSYNILLNKPDAAMGRTFTNGRGFANKVIALLTDGVPNISPTGDDESPEFASGTDYIDTNSSTGKPYAEYWAKKCRDEKIVVHTICVGTNAEPIWLQNSIAGETGGQAFVVADPAADIVRLNDIFIAIGKDKIGKLYGN